MVGNKASNFFFFVTIRKMFLLKLSLWHGQKLLFNPILLLGTGYTVPLSITFYLV